jgi:hypothetical protein
MLSIDCIQQLGIQLHQSLFVGNQFLFGLFQLGTQLLDANRDHDDGDGDGDDNSAPQPSVLESCITRTHAVHLYSPIHIPSLPIRFDHHQSCALHREAPALAWQHDAVYWMMTRPPIEQLACDPMCHRYRCFERLVTMASRPIEVMTRSVARIECSPMPSLPNTHSMLGFVVRIPPSCLAVAIYRVPLWPVALRDVPLDPLADHVQQQDQSTRPINQQINQSTTNQQINQSANQPTTGIARTCCRASSRSFNKRSSNVTRLASVSSLEICFLARSSCS